MARVASETPGTVGSLLALVAHDLRNPLSALHSNVGFLEATLSTKDTDALDALADISASCSSLKHIIDNLELVGLSHAAEKRPGEISPSSGSRQRISASAPTIAPLFTATCGW